MARLNSACSLIDLFLNYVFALFVCNWKPLQGKSGISYTSPALRSYSVPSSFGLPQRCVTRVEWRTSAIFTLCTTNQNKARETLEMDGLIISSRVIGNQKAFSSKWLHTSVLRKRVQANSSGQCLNGPFHQFGIFLTLLIFCPRKLVCDEFLHKRWQLQHFNDTVLWENPREQPPMMNVLEDEVDCSQKTVFWSRFRACA